MARGATRGARSPNTLASVQSEAEFLDAVIEYAQLHHWLAHHCRPAQKRDGSWSTPVQGDPGFPDLVLVRHSRVVFAELKKESVKGRPTAEQERWLHELWWGKAWSETQAKRVQAFIWVPSDWPEIEKVLE